MKKIALCSLLMCFGYIGIVSAGELYCKIECNAAREGKVALCPQQSNSETVDQKTKVCKNGKWEGDWKVVISPCDNHKKPDGWMDFGKYRPEDPHWNEIYAFFNSPKTGVAYVVSQYATTDNGLVGIEEKQVCYGCRQGFEWVDEKGCVATSKTQIAQQCDPNHPELCNQNARMGQLAEPCAGRAEKDQCFALSANAELGRCRNLSATKGGQTQMTCSAVKCKPGNYLWLDKNGNSMGVCHSKSYMDSMCANNKCGCGEGLQCVPNIVDIPSSITINGYNLTAEQRKDGAYRECHCVAQRQNDEHHDDTDPQPKNCLYKFKADVQCANGQSVHIEKETMVSEMNCDQYNAMYGADVNHAMAIFGNLCPDTSVLSSVAKLEQFKKYAESHRSGLKTKDGKFNTVRLASDISAGVVLGTVGGVVSGVVIKKKQLEKGYDALHCTVGGQTIADWGDEFVVGLQR